MNQQSRFNYIYNYIYINYIYNIKYDKYSYDKLDTSVSCTNL